MVRDVRYDAAPSMVILGWKSLEDGLHLRVRGVDDDVRVECHCGRFHWIVREQFSGGRALLLLTCHNCGQRVSFVIEGVRLPTP